jgi:hypothetical protein
MDARASQVQDHSLVARVIPVIVGLALLWGGAALLMGRVSLAAAQPGPSLETHNDEEAQPLTPAQQEARQLAMILSNKPESQRGATAANSASITVDQPLRLGSRSVMPLFALQGVEGRLVGGQQTFASPVEQVSPSVAEDANRPLFVPATQAVIAVDILVE